MIILCIIYCTYYKIFYIFIFKFFYLLILKGGIFDGPTGWLYCRMQAHYEFMCVTILKELRQK